MHAYIVTTHQKLEPFGEHPRDCLVGNVPLHRVQDTALQRAGLIEYQRGKLIVLNRAGLEAAACSCYAAHRHTYTELLERP